MQTCTLAVDIGASSGRHIAGTVQNGKITLQEVYRFENGVHRENGHLCWDIDTLAQEVVNGLKAAHDAGFAPATIGIDTWAVDFVLLDADNKRIGDAVAYRDERTEGIREALEKEYGLTFADHYARTGIQYQPFNTVYQLMALKKEHPEQLAAAKTFLMVPDYLNYLLCGVPANEYTNASTTALVGADSRDWDDALIEKLGLPRGIFQPIKTAGTVLGHLTPEMQKAVGFDAEVILPATHDTGSAFLAVPARDEYAAYLSSGTWSLLGVENAAAITGPDSCAANFTNEGGYEYRYRYLKNIMGLWMIQSVRRELGEKTGTRPSFPELIAARARRHRRGHAVRLQLPDAGLPPRRGDLAKPDRQDLHKPEHRRRRQPGRLPEPADRQRHRPDRVCRPHRGHSAGQPDGAVHPQRRFCRPGRGPRRHPAQL